mgnify:CR=1 FL=1
MSIIPKRTFTEFIVEEDVEDIEADLIEKKQLVQDFRNLSLEDNPFKSSNIRVNSSSNP